MRRSVNGTRTLHQLRNRLYVPRETKPVCRTRISRNCACWNDRSVAGSSRVKCATMARSMPITSNLMIRCTHRLGMLHLLTYLYQFSVIEFQSLAVSVHHRSAPPVNGPPKNPLKTVLAARANAQPYLCSQNGDM